MSYKSTQQGINRGIFKEFDMIIYDLPKISLNQWYSGKHWTERKRIKDIYKLMINKNKVSGVFHCEYHFEFKSRPLDASNCVAMVKMIEDCIIENDSFKNVKSIKITSNKGLRDLVRIKMFEVK